MPRIVLDAEPPYVYTTDRPAPLDYLTGIGGREISVGPRIVAFGSDAADRTVVASATVSISVGLTTLSPTAWPAFSADQGCLIEKLVAGVTFTDASAQLQLFNIGVNNYLTPVRIQASLPFTAPPISGYTFYCTQLHPTVVVRKSEDAIITQGASVQVLLKNLDGAASHVYRLTIYALVRAISNIYTDGHVSYPG